MGVRHIFRGLHESRVMNLPVTAAAVVLSFFVVALLPQSASAENHAEQNDGGNKMESEKSKTGDFCLKKYQPSRAMWLSGSTTLVGTVVGFGVAGIGFATEKVGLFTFGAFTGALFLIVGPSTGHFYVENKIQAWVGISLRTVMISAAVYGAIMSFFRMMGAAECEVRPGVECSERHERMEEFWPEFAVSTAATAFGLALFDIFTAKRAARKANEKACEGLNVMFVPTIVPEKEDGTRLGLSVTVVF